MPLARLAYKYKPELTKYCPLSLVFEKALKELMILGTISFVLFILKDQNIYDQSDDTFTNTFDVSIFLS